MAGPPTPAPLRTYQYGGETLVHHSLQQYAYVDGLAQARKLMRFDVLLAEPWNGAMIRLADSGLLRGKAAAPVGHTPAVKGGKGKPRRFSRHAPGQLRDKISAAHSRRQIIGWVALRSRGTQRDSKGGYPYPRALNYAPGFKRGRRGVVNKRVGWFDRGVIEPIMAMAGGVLDEAARQIERKWANG